MNVQGRGTIGGIQALRGVAALMVVVYHLFPQLYRMGYDGPEIATLSAGVDIFFVISGFIMWRTTHENPTRTTLGFYRDRFVRIVPLYWLLTSAVVLILVAAPGLVQTLKFDLGHILKSYFFLPALNPGDGSITPPLSPGWTLNYELFFYLIFGLAMWASQVPITRAAIITASLSALVVLGALSRPSLELSFYTNNIILEFAFGIGLGILYPRLPTAPRLSWLLIVLGFALLAANPLAEPWSWRAVGYGIPATIIVAGAMGLSRTPTRALSSLGDASYSLYLSHFLTMSAAGQVWRRLDGPMWAFPVVGVLVCVAVGYATYFILERPITRAFKQLLKSHAHNRPLGSAA